MTLQEAIENVALKRKARKRAHNAMEQAKAESLKCNTELEAAEAQLQTIMNRAIDNAS